MAEVRVQLPLGALQTRRLANRAFASGGVASPVSSMTASCAEYANWLRFALRPSGAAETSSAEERASRIGFRSHVDGNRLLIQTFRLVRWYSCWYGWAAVNRFGAGSIPATAACWSTGVSLPFNQLKPALQHQEVIRLDQEPVSKTGAGQASATTLRAVPGSSPTASASANIQHRTSNVRSGSSMFSVRC